MFFVISANRLKDGAVVYLTSSNCWSEQLEDARIVKESELDEMQQVGHEAESQNTIVGAYAVEIEKREKVQPKKLRERIRYLGPTVGDHQHRSFGGSEG